MKSLWLPWLWRRSPDFPDDVPERLGAPLQCAHRRGVDSNPLGRDTGANLAHLSVVFSHWSTPLACSPTPSRDRGIHRAAAACIFDGVRHFGGAVPAASVAGLFSDENIYAILIMGVTSLYVIKGGMISVVVTRGDAVHDSDARGAGHRLYRDLQGCRRT